MSSSIRPTPARARARSPPPRRRRARRASRARISASASASSRSRLSPSSWRTWSSSSSTIRRTSASISSLVASDTGSAPGSSAPWPSRGATARKPTFVAHPPALDHAARDPRDLLDVGLGAGRGLVVDDLLGHAPAARNLDLRPQLVLGVVEAVVLRRRQRDAERLAARDDRHLAHRVGAGGEHADDRVAALVVGDPAAVGLADQHDLALGAQHDLLERVGEVGALDLVVAAPRGQQGRLVDEVGQVGADHARGRLGDLGEVDVVGERDRARVDAQDLLAALAVGRLDEHAPVEAPGAQQRRVEHVRPVGRAEHDHARPRGRSRPSR